MSISAMEMTPRHPLEDMVRRQLVGTAYVADLQMLVGDAGLILEGRADSFYAKQIAQHVAAQVTGLGIVANRIGVQVVASADVD